jgi:hypothetical protein
MAKKSKIKRLRINGFRPIVARDVVDTFEICTMDEKRIDLYVTDDGHYWFGSRWQCLGWTDDATHAFRVRDAMSLCTFQEAYDHVYTQF